jgi:hypothetical protein
MNMLWAVGRPIRLGFMSATLLGGAVYPPAIWNDFKGCRTPYSLCVWLRLGFVTLHDHFGFGADWRNVGIFKKGRIVRNDERG